MTTKPFKARLNEFERRFSPFSSTANLLETTDEFQLRIPKFTIASIVSEGLAPRKEIDQFFKDFKTIDGKPFTLHPTTEETEQKAASEALNIAQNILINATVRIASYQLESNGELTLLISGKTLKPIEKLGTIEKTIQGKVNSYLKHSKLPNITNTTLNLIPFNIPSKLKLLSTTKTYQPLTLNTLTNILSAQNYSFPNSAWLKRELDELWRNKLVIWDNNNYLITESGLRAIPVRFDKHSSDVKRALELGRRYGYGTK